ncbi:hypothetical protein SKAU_G00340740 [Synaphobranchus kaupii]|uniref:CID domain-containing protein n=1 Tax=Synaphobranchus kaupii TaxID=118154 RepID=A0A9Q1EMY2_SYNKA|nr:hypothetical protein SKAU_G00340740 [Synaphobranchus kaupii]
MEAVKAFNGELYSLNEYKPPISKAKMTQITKSAIKAIKFYKHVVQSVEKFIQKCKPEYKVPGLYVVDSIVRQSRHQFGQEKDVFAPRFSKNIISTFQNLYRCPSDDKVGPPTPPAAVTAGVSFFMGRLREGRGCWLTLTKHNCAMGRGKGSHYCANGVSLNLSADDSRG